MAGLRGRRGRQADSPLTPDRPRELSRLRVAWTYRTGRTRRNVSRLGAYASRRRRSFGRHPLLSTPYNQVIALDPATGGRDWSYDAKIDPGAGFRRHVAGRLHMGDSGASGSPSVAGASSSATLTRVWSRLMRRAAPRGAFGRGGTADLKRGARPPRLPRLSGDVATRDSRRSRHRRFVDRRQLERRPGSGVVRSFDARTGALRWSWQPVPRERARKGGKSWRRGRRTRGR